MSRLQTGAVIGAAISTLLLSLLDTNILTAAAPSIGRDLGGGAVAQVPWLIVAYALAETVAQPLYGRLADRHGPRPVLLAALALFGARLGPLRQRRLDARAGRPAGACRGSAPRVCSASPSS